MELFRWPRAANTFFKGSSLPWHKACKTMEQVKLLTAWNGVLWKLIFTLVVKKFLLFCGIQRFVIVCFIKPCCEPFKSNPYLHILFRIHVNITSITPPICRNTTTYFGPICGPSSDCDLTYRAAIQDVWGVLWGFWGLGGTRSHCFSNGYHDLGLLQVSLVIYVHLSKYVTILMLRIC
jgi:hypothetical protein